MKLMPLGVKQLYYCIVWPKKLDLPFPGFIALIYIYTSIYATLVHAISVT